MVVTYKWHDLVPGSGVVDLELGRFPELTYNDWITDTTAGSQIWGIGHWDRSGFLTPHFVQLNTRSLAKPYVIGMSSSLCWFEPSGFIT